MRTRTRDKLRRAVAERAGAIAGRSAYSSMCTRCAYCGLTIEATFKPDSSVTFYAPSGDKVHLDHIVPESRNGATSPDNTVLACSSCNRAKRDRAFGDREFQMWLQHRRLEVWLSQLPGTTARQIAQTLAEMDAYLEDGERETV